MSNAPGRSSLNAQVRGVVLTGGASRRMGRTKALVDVGGDAAELRELGVPVIPDLHPGDGPLGAILTVLDTIDPDTGRALVVACDLPMLDVSVIRALTTAADASDVDVVVAVTTRREPMCAVWASRALPVLRSLFETGERSIDRAFDALRVTEVDVDPAALVNVNTPDDLAAVQYARSVAIREITVDELAALGDGVSLVDVRETHEWDDGHISYAELVPLATVPDHVDSFRGSPTYVICRSGGRSAKACEFLLAQGVDVVNVAGGMLAWEARGLPVEAGADGSVGG